MKLHSILSTFQASASLFYKLQRGWLIIKKQKMEKLKQVSTVKILNVANKITG